MFELFRMEAENQTSILSQALLDLEQNPHSEEKLETLMRASHSMKGAARIVGIETVVSIAHKMEDCFVGAQRSNFSLTSQHIDALLKAVDIIYQIAQLPESQLQDWLIKKENEIQGLEDLLDFILKNHNQYSEKSAFNTSSKLNSATTTNQEFPIADLSRTGVTENSETLQLALDSNERVLRIDADRLTRLMGLSSELLVESRWLKPFSMSMVQLKRRYSDISSVLETLRDGINPALVSEHNYSLLSEAQHKLATCRKLLTERILDLDDFDRRSNFLSSQVYNEVIASRMRPFKDSIKGLQRMARDVARSLGKEVRLEFAGLETPVDREVLEKLKAPLNHLIRNAIDHGIETPKIREKSGKLASGIIKIQASHIGGMLYIVVEDDGAGINLEALKQKVIKRKLASKEMMGELSELELVEFLFLPDFSTREQVTEISGRGVGLDAVRTLVQEMRGSVWTVNREGEGVKFTLQLPLSLSVISAILVDIGNEPYAFPLTRVDGLTTVEHEKIKIMEGRQYAEIGDELVGLVSAAQVLGFDEVVSDKQYVHAVVISNNETKYGVVIDCFVGERNLSVQSLDSRLGKIQDISATALTEEGNPVLIIDVDDLLRSIDALVSGGPISHFSARKEFNSNIIRKRILVIDDSMTVREVERKLLETQGYQVDVAVDGIDGWNAIRRNKYHLIITDVDMPRMDGIELVHAMKQDFHMKSLPVMIVSYKDRAEDKKRGLDAGADYYLTKGSFHDETLIEAVMDLIGEAIA